MRIQSLQKELSETAEVLFSNISLDPAKAYFLYVGEIKAYWLNSLMKRPLERIYEREVDFISIVPDVLARPIRDNLVVINSSSRKLLKETGIPHNVRLSGDDFAAQVSSSTFVNDLVQELLVRQESLFVNMFESMRSMDLVDGKSVRLIGPDPNLASNINNKLVQFDMVKGLGIPVPEGGGHETLESAVSAAGKMLEKGYFVFVSEEYSAAGSNSIIARSKEDIIERFCNSESKYLVTRFIEHEYDPTVLGVVANEDQVYIASVADQNISGTQFTGSTFPTVLDDKTAREVREMTRHIGRYLGSIGYRGVFGCDYVVDHDKEVYFIEINARKQGTTLETSLTMKHHMPHQPYFPELEFIAVSEGRLPEDIEEMDLAPKGLCWGTHNIKVDHDVEIHRCLEPECTQYQLFEGVPTGGRKMSRYIVEDHVGSSVRQKAGGFLARIIAASDNCDNVNSALKEGAQKVRSTFRKLS